MKIFEKISTITLNENKDYSPQEVEEYFRKSGINIEKINIETQEIVEKLKKDLKVIQGRIKQLKYEEMRKGKEINTTEEYGIVNMEGNIAYSFRKEGSNSEEEKKMEKKYIEKDLKELEQLKKIEI